MSTNTANGNLTADIVTSAIKLLASLQAGGDPTDDAAQLASSLRQARYLRDDSIVEALSKRPDRWNVRLNVEASVTVLAVRADTPEHAVEVAREHVFLGYDAWRAKLLASGIGRGIEIPGSTASSVVPAQRTEFILGGIMWDGVAISGDGAKQEYVDLSRED